MLIEDQAIPIINLKYFCDAVRYGTVVRAATYNFVTPSAISQGITKLEKNLGIKLVEHHRNNFKLTACGEIVFKKATILLQQCKEFRESITQIETKAMDDLVFASTYSFALAVISDHLKTFRNLYPHVKVRFFLSERWTIKQLAKTEKIDFAILPNEDDLEDFEKREIYAGYFNCYLSETVPIEEHERLEFIVTQPHSAEMQFLKKSYYKKFQTKLPECMVVDSWEMIANLAASGMGKAYLPDYFASRKAYALKACEYGLEELPYSVCAIFPKEAKLRTSSEIFLSFFDSELGRVVD